MQDPTGKLMNMQGFPGISLALIWEGLRGDVGAIREIMDRTDGKVGASEPEGNNSPKFQIYFITPKERINESKNRIKALSI
jgi:hypothetical protein